MDCFKTAQWIWLNKSQEKDSYVEFYQSVLWQGRKAICRISCDGDYTIFVNGHYVASRQYDDYEHYKIYDELDITAFLNEGKNHFAVLVWRFGEDSQKSVLANPGLIYEVVQDDGVLACSGSRTLCRKSLAYRSGYQKKITVQLGFSFLYDATKVDDWINGAINKDFAPAKIVRKKCAFVSNPIKKIKPGERIGMKILNDQDNRYLIDLGREITGIPVLEFRSESEQMIRVEWGEDLQNGHVRRIIHDRDFSFEYKAKPGENEYTNYMLAIGARYLDIYTESPIEIVYIGLRPWTYPVKILEKSFSNLLDQNIYDVCVNTLKLCMLERYVDTPWREQCLYAFDARNQMLSGYYAFEGKNAEYARANLKLISQDRREDGLLSISYPCGIDLTIPSFSLYYFMAVNEYITHTGDVSLGKEVYTKLLSILEAFTRNRKDGLLYRLDGANHWNFYDWSQYLDGNSKAQIPDLMVNCLFIVALKNLQNIEYTVNGMIAAYQDLIDESATVTRKTFYNKEKGLFSLTQNGNAYTVLGNAFAVLAGLTDKEESEYICKCLIEGELSDCSLSMKTFKYDALLSVDREKYANVVLDEIRSDYGKMLDNGATSVWETIEGAAAFDNAGSLCHGWSAIPVVYYHLLEHEAC